MNNMRVAAVVLGTICVMMVGRGRRGGVVSANMYDVVSPTLVHGDGCSTGCEIWNKTSDAYKGCWMNETILNEAGSFCAQPGQAPALTKPSPVLDPTEIGGQGAWCVCASGSAKEWDYCQSTSDDVPEQINLQLAGPDTVVVSFVTFDESAPSDPPIGSIKKSGETGDGRLLTGVTHTYVTPSKTRVYYMHFVTFADLQPRAEYTYRVKSGGFDAKWSDSFTFRAPYAEGETNVAIFGDMGVYAWNNMENMLSDAEDGRIDAVVHIGDHAYNMGGEDERRGDGYMQAYEKILTRVPWMPVVGNHEFYDGDDLKRYLNQTDGSVVAATSGGDHKTRRGWSTATSALGSLLSTGNHHSAGIYGSVPSNTSRYYSVDLGLIHFVALDLNLYNGVDTLCGDACRQAQLTWLEEDLRNANENRADVPWIVAMSHFPLYCSNCPAPGHEPGAWWDSEYCEYVGHDESCVVPSTYVDLSSTPSGDGRNVSSSPGNDDMVPDFEPLFMKYGVDVYASGHIHDYEFIYPVYNNKAVQKNFTNPLAPVHLVTGNGGPPSASSFHGFKDWSYVHSEKDIGTWPNGLGSYTRMTAYNSSSMRFQQVANWNNEILDELVIHQRAHGPFPRPKW